MTVTVSTKATRAAVSLFEKVPANPTAAQVGAYVNTADKASGVLALSVYRLAAHTGMSEPQIQKALREVGSPRSAGSIANDKRTGALLDRMIQGGHVPTLDDIRAAVSLGNANQDETKAIAAAVEGYGSATGADLSNLLPKAKEQRSAIRSAKTKAGQANNRKSGEEPKDEPKGSTKGSTDRASNGDTLDMVAALLASVTSPLGITPEHMDTLRNEVERITALVEAAPPVTKANPVVRSQRKAPAGK